MTDEANAHYFSIITELMEGHEFLRNHIGTESYTPTTHWSIDPFGLSPTLPYLLSASNISNAAVQRVHYSVKKYLAKNKQLEFMWRQLWGSHGKRDIRTHMFPFYSYDIPHSCGPDPSVCCQFDFAYVKLYCSELLCCVTSTGRRANFIKPTFFLYLWEMTLGTISYLLCGLIINARFGTLNDYFVELDRSLRADQKVLPVLSGDFFTYADRDDHYWSGSFFSLDDVILSFTIFSRQISKVFPVGSCVMQYP
ncbi:unnamed protein product [Nippostrongylus brasiliensis]|uniref:Alpha-mannosidase 2 (inferred by orthology to a D. melanogaster protein) n=1 Tax=Nippostrongylus brasiliensis TaxID=27835 RepID=A0A0N4Y814_NIPBR|nr:unnamed protein product [Nippostrongylus brasiliensis]